MPKDYKNNKFKILELNLLEIDLLEWGNKCDSCNIELNAFKDKFYYIAALNKCFCKECCDDIIKGLPPISNTADKIFEEKHYNYVIETLNVDNIIKELEDAKADQYLATIEAHDIDNL